MKKLLLMMLFGLLLSSCNKDFQEETQSTVKGEKTFNDLNFTQNDKLRTKFGKALVQALHENESLRELIKEEALKQFNKDYDVLYQLVKNKEVKGTSTYAKLKSQSYSTFRSILLGYFSSENELLEIENSLPLLTLFVPKLPEDSFSAASWNTSLTEQSPAIAIRMDDCNDVPIIFNSTDEYVLEGKYLPSFPVIVLKDNERVVTNSMIGYDALTTTTLLGSDGLSFRFIDVNLDPNIVTSNPNFVNPLTPIDPQSVNLSFSSSKTNNIQQSSWFFIPGRDLTVAPFLVNAHNVFNGTTSNPWQRDHIYYSLTTTNTTGIMNNFYKEAITYFHLRGDAAATYNHISQRSPGNPDPALEFTISRNPGPAWTDGNFEFTVYFVHGSKSDSNGTNSKRVFTAPPGDVFNVSYTKRSIGMMSRFRNPIFLWIPNVTSIKPIDFLNGYNGQLLIMAKWNLIDLSNKFTFRFEESDIPVYNEVSRSQGSKHNMNVSLDASTGDEKKVGLKFGASAEYTANYIRKWSWTTQGFNFLGEQQIDFSDNIVNKHPLTNKFYPALFSGGIVSFELRPIQTNF